MPPPIQRPPPTHFRRPVQQPNCRVIPNRSPIRHVAHSVVWRPRILLRQRQRHDRSELVDGPQWIAQSRHATNITLLHNSVKYRLAVSSVAARGLDKGSSDCETRHGLFQWLIRIPTLVWRNRGVCRWWERWCAPLTRCVTKSGAGVARRRKLFLGHELMYRTPAPLSLQK